jgi:3-methyladenine DNA glycosylase AlkD
MNIITEEIIAEMHRHYDAKRADASRRYFREPVEAWGLSMSLCKKIAVDFYPRIKGDTNLAIEIVGELHRKGVLEVAIVGDYMLKKMKSRLTPSHFNIFDAWVDTLTNWANTDSLCTGIIAETIRRDPKLVERVLEWAKSENRWRRRASVVSLVPIVRRGNMLCDALRISDELMEDPDDMVQKGVGWLLKEASKVHPEEIRDYLIRWRPRASALILRYASEKLPHDKRVLKRS